MLLALFVVTQQFISQRRRPLAPQASVRTTWYHHWHLVRPQEVAFSVSDWALRTERRHRNFFLSLESVEKKARRISVKEIDETVNTATSIEEAPPQWQKHFRLRSEEIGTDQKILVTAIESYVRSRKSWGTGGHVDMDIGAISKDNARGKGKYNGASRMQKGDEGVRHPKGWGEHKGQGEGNGHEQAKQITRRKTTTTGVSESVLFVGRLDVLQ